MRTVERLMVCVLGLIGAVDALIITIFVTLYRTVARLAGANIASSHGLVGVGLVVLALVGAILAVFFARVGGVLLLIAGIGFFFFAHWWALLASPQLLIAGVMAILATQEALPLGHRPAPAPPLPAT